MKTPEDEAFEDIERRQGGFQAKRQMAADKLQDEADMLTIAYLDGYEKGKKAALAQPAQEPRNVRERWNVELDGNDLLVCFNDHEKGDKCQYERYSPQREWNAALDHAAERIGEIQGFGKATQDSFAVYIKGLKR